MYNSAKQLLLKFVPREWLIKNEETFRSIYSLLYSGNEHQCCVCNKKLKSFIQLPNNDLLCPKCGSLARDRRLWLNEQPLLQNGVTFLDFSPSRCLARRLVKKKNITYLNTDLSGNFIASYRYDITQLPLENNSIDLISCYHILEHIDNDAQAMSELYRVLKPGGTALVQTPFKEGDIYEDFSITTPQEREIHFGQDDHVRIYSVQGLKTRLEKAGFNVTVSKYEAEDYHGLTAEVTLKLSKK